MRGKGLDRPLSDFRYGITPAHAGKRSSSNSTTTWTRDHPRVCGEKPYRSMQPRLCVGSPPHMRGKDIAKADLLCRDRITPAYAGKSFVDFACFGVLWDHPRICGEKPALKSAADCALGSPPHMRGKVTTLIRSTSCVRITPAYAGKRPKKSRSTVSPAAIVLPFPLVCNRPGAHPSATITACARPYRQAGPASRPSQFPPRITVISPRP